MNQLIPLKAQTDTETGSVIQEEKKFSGEDVYGRRVILFNDDLNSFEHVENCLMKICFKSKNEARKIALEAHSRGKAVCYKGSFEECETVASLMAEEHLTVALE